MGSLNEVTVEYQEDEIEITDENNTSDAFVVSTRVWARVHSKYSPSGFQGTFKVLKQNL